MKTIKVKFCNADLTDKFSLGGYFLRLLSRFYKVELSEKPDYVFYNDSDFEYLKFDCVRIFYTGENISPNFNLCDYAIGMDYLTFRDRYCRMPVYLMTQFYSDAELELALKVTGQMTSEGIAVERFDFTKQLPFTKQDLEKKTAFCSFVYSNYLADPVREEFYTKLSAYKRVDSGGAHLNNIGHRVSSKLDFQLTHKFSIAFENSCNSGYITDRLPNGIVARTIPIYWGNPDIGREFNEKRFINCHAYENFDEVVAKVKELDQNDNLYLDMVNQSVITANYNFRSFETGLETFIKHIIEQPIKKATRRNINAARRVILEESEILTGNRLTRKNAVRKQLAWLYKPFKKFPLFEKLKQKTLAKRVHEKDR